VTSANIACGAHAGDAASMRQSVKAALGNHVKIGAHVSYPDREGFGRRELSLPAAKLTAAVLEQIQVLDAVARSQRTQVHYLKAHGALYNRMADDAETADAVLAAMKSFDAGMPLLTLPGSVAMERARLKGVRAVAEAFADRAYNSASRLVPRSRQGAVITDVAKVVQQAVTLATTGAIASIEGAQITIHARSLCLHGDTPGAVQLARAVRTALEKAGVKLGAFA
ncbi:MAG: LamB/YcsF family protein, partial [Gammaproteobacteria bacterium]|nr:LamB/YcsF family protein [Gammaproteobacteria bacterium]